MFEHEHVLVRETCSGTMFRKHVAESCPGKLERPRAPALPLALVSKSCQEKKFGKHVRKQFLEYIFKKNTSYI